MPLSRVPRMKTSTILGILLCVSAVARGAHADDAADKAACLDAASKGQRLRDAHKFVGARDQLRVCARAQCPAVVQSDCANWLEAVEKALPTVVVTAKNGAGADLIDVKVTADGEPFAARLDGQAVAIDPGPHTFRFEAADGTRVDQQVVVREGSQSQPITVVLGAPPAPVAPAAPTAPTASPAPAPPPASPFPWKTVGWVVGGAGVLGLGIGAVGGLLAIGDKNSAHCNSNNVCTDGGPLKDASGAATLADVGFVAGGLLLAGGVALIVLGPDGPKEGGASGAGVKVVPSVSSGGGGLLMAGTW
jgi:hypothetical protein